MNLLYLGLGERASVIRLLYVEISAHEDPRQIDGSVAQVGVLHALLYVPVPRHVRLQTVPVRTPVWADAAIMDV